MNYIKTVIGVVIILLSAEVSAQRLLTKKEAIQITLENNYGIKLAENNVEIAKNNSSIYNSGFFYHRYLQMVVQIMIIAIKKLIDKMVQLQ